jgi:YVTN family beta-propeller protein
MVIWISIIVQRKKWMRLLLLATVLLPIPWMLPRQAAKQSDIRLRRPIALTLLDDGKTLLIADRDSGTVSAWDTNKRKRLSETRVDRKLSDMTATPNGNLILVTDAEAGEVIVLGRRQGSLQEVRRIKVSLSPVSVQVREDGKLATAACLWTRRLAIFDPGNPSQVDQVDLPFAPRRQLLVPGTSKVIVADSFAGQLAVVDLQRKELESVRNLAIHNIRGLALDRQKKNLLLTHQTINGRAHTTKGEIRTGNLITNNIRKIVLADLLDPLADVSRHERLYSLGDVELGAGDPAALAQTFNEQILVAVSGTNEVVIGRPEMALWTRVPVGRRPTALSVDPVRKRAYVANTFADSISIVDLQAHKVIGEISLGKSPELTAEKRGELLFFDARLSFDSWFSCHSCHPDGHTNGRLNDNFTDGSFGTPKRVLSLLGVKDTGPWAWNGKMPDLEAQVRNSLRSTLQGLDPSTEAVRDLTTFLKTLPPPPGLSKARNTIDSEAFQRGKKIFARQKCATCHTPPTYTSPKTYDVGLRDEAGEKQFNPPSLRGLSQAGPYFHDNRALSLREVFSRYRHELAGALSNQELSDLLHFLEGL